MLSFARSSAANARFSRAQSSDLTALVAHEQAVRLQAFPQRQHSGRANERFVEELEVTETTEFRNGGLQEKRTVAIDCFNTLRGSSRSLSGFSC